MGEVISLLDKKKKNKDKVGELLVEHDWNAIIKANRERKKKQSEESLKQNKTLIRAFNLKKNK